MSTPYIAGDGQKPGYAVANLPPLYGACLHRDKKVCCGDEMGSDGIALSAPGLLRMG